MKILTILLLGNIILLNASTYNFVAVDKSNKKRNLVPALIPDMSQFISQNISRKSAGATLVPTCSDISKVFRSDKKVIWSSNSLRSRPVTLKLIDKNGVETLKQINEENITSKFEIPINKLETGTRLQVFNVFNNSIFCSNIQLLDKNSTR